MIEVAPGLHEEVTFDEAVLYCFFCTYNGHKDWRLPTSAEYQQYSYRDAMVSPVLVGCWDSSDSDKPERFKHKLPVTPVRTI